MPTFGIRPGSFKELRGKLLLRMVVFFLAILLYQYFLHANGSDFDRSDAAFILFFIVICVFSYFFAMRRQKTLFESILLTVSEKEITRTQLNTPTKTLRADEIVRIERFPNGIFVIKGATAADTLWMPSQTASPEDLARELGRFGPLVNQPAPAWYKAYASLIGLLVLPLMYFFYTSSSKVITGVTGSILLVSLGYSYWTIQRSKDIDYRTKRNSHLMWLLMASLLYVLVYKLQ